MNKTILLLTTLTALTFAGAQSLEPQTLMTTRDTLVLTDDLSAISSAWKAGKGKWEIVDGAVQGTEIPADKHAATFRQNLQFQDGIIAVQFKLNGAKQISLSLNDATGHLARVVIAPTGFQARKDDHDHKGADKAVPFNMVKTNLEVGRWYGMVLEFSGQEMLARLVGDGNESVQQMKVSLGSHEALVATKANLGFTVTGGSASFRYLRLYKALANPDWSKTKAILEALLKK